MQQVRELVFLSFLEGHWQEVGSLGSQLWGVLLSARSAKNQVDDSWRIGIAKDFYNWAFLVETVELGRILHFEGVMLPERRLPGNGIIIIM